MLKIVSQRLQLKMILVVMLALLIPTALIGTYSIGITTAEVLRTAEEKNLQFVKSQSVAALRFLAEVTRRADQLLKLRLRRAPDSAGGQKVRFPEVAERLLNVRPGSVLR